MSGNPDRQVSARVVNVVVDNDSWILPFARSLVTNIESRGDKAFLIRQHADVREGDIAFYLGCIHVASGATLVRNKKNLVVHASDLPRGRGFSPLSWLVLAGEHRIPVALLEAVEEFDAGPIVYKEWIEFEGHELLDELRERLGRKTVELCQNYLAAPAPVASQAQEGEPTFFGRRRARDSELDVDKSIAEQFNLLRIVDNKGYPAYFRFRGHEYVLSIEKRPKKEPG